MKKTNKNTKPVIVVDLTDIEDYRDVQFEFTRGKAKAGYPLTDQEINAVVAYGAHLALDTIDAFLSQFSMQYIELTDKKQIKKAIKAIEKLIKPKKQPWYKHFWNWVKKPFVKK